MAIKNGPGYSRGKSKHYYYSPIDHSLNRVIYYVIISIDLEEHTMPIFDGSIDGAAKLVKGEGEGPWIADRVQVRLDRVAAQDTKPRGFILDKVSFRLEAFPKHGMIVNSLLICMTHVCKTVGPSSRR